MYSHRKLTIEYREVCNSGRVLVEMLPRGCLPPFSTPCPIEVVMHGPWVGLSTANVSTQESNRNGTRAPKSILNSVQVTSKSDFDDLFQLILPTSAQCHHYRCHSGLQEIIQVTCNRACTPDALWLYTDTTTVPKDMVDTHLMLEARGSCSY